MNLKESLEIIKRHWDSVPVPVETIASDLEVPIEYRALPQNISGAIERCEGGYKIVVNNTHARTRQRFTIAHELGHYIYHRDLLGQGVGDTLAFRAEGTPFPNPSITVVHERQANTFASNLLMPNHLVSKLKRQGLRTPEQLAAALEVSPEAMRIKLGLNRPEFERPAPDDDNVEVRVGGRPVRDDPF